MKLLIIGVLSAIALANAGVVPTDVSIDLPEPIVPVVNPIDVISDHIKVVDGTEEQFERVDPLVAPYLEDAQVVKEPEVNVADNVEQPAELQKVRLLNRDMLDGLKSKILEALNAKKASEENAEVEDVVVVKEPEVPEAEFDENVAADSPYAPEIAEDRNIIDFDPNTIVNEVSELSNNEQVKELLRNLQAEVMNRLKNINIQEIREHLSNKNVVVVKEADEVPELSEKVQVVDHPEVSKIGEDLNVIDFDPNIVNVVDDAAFNNENLQEVLRNVKNNILERLENHFNQEKPQEFEQVGKDLNIIDFDPNVVNVVDEAPVFTDNFAHYDFVHIINNPVDVPVQFHKQVIIVGSPLDIVEEFHRIVEQVQVAEQPEMNPPRIVKFPNPLLR